MKTGSIYIIKNKINDKIYIGQTTMSVKDRWYAHRKPSVQKKRKNYKLYNAMNKYGVDNFYYEILYENIPIDELNELEIKTIEKYDSYNNGYNSTKGGDGRVINKIEDELKIVELAKQGKNSKEIAEIYNVCKDTILRILRKNNFYYYNNIEINILNELLQENKTIREIAEYFNVSEISVKRFMNKNNINYSNIRKEYINIRDDFDYSLLIEKYYNNETIENICDYFDISRTTFYRIKDKLNLKNRPQIYKNKIRYYE